MGLSLLDPVDTRRAILDFIKCQRVASIAEIAAELDLSYEAVRQQVLGIRREGWIDRRYVHRSQRGAGRPRSCYFLTPAGENFFPKYYDLLSVELIDAILRQSGMEGLRRVLGDLADARVRQWAPRLDGLDLRAKLEALRDIYLEEDPYTVVEDGEAGLRLIEQNCPFFNVARQRPALCSLTVSTLERLLGYKVLREEQFQRGHGRCAFRILQDQPLESDEFRFEAASPAS